MYKIGKVNNYDGLAGTIVTPDKEYNFIKSALNNPDIKDGDLVKFSTNGNEDFPVAYFIEPLAPNEKDLFIKDEN